MCFSIEKGGTITSVVRLLMKQAYKKEEGEAEEGWGGGQVT
jgi:hypothetical protein